jgi:2-hydroxychromene-2-carboxylate isomerase
LLAESNASAGCRHGRVARPSGHWGVPTFVFENEPFFGQDRIDLLIWRMQDKGLNHRKP